MLARIALLAVVTAATIGSAAAQPPAASDLPPMTMPATADALRIALVLTLATVLPAIVISMTAFVRIVIVLSIVRHGLGMPETPPNQVLVGLALFLTIFTMLPTFQTINDRAMTPFLEGRMTVAVAAREASDPLKAFMLRQVGDEELRAVYQMTKTPLPDTPAEVDLLRLVPAFLMHELKTAFRIGFVILLPFLLIDLVVSSVLLALGMLMVPPATISLPIKVLMFVLIDGWGLLLQGLVGSFR